MTVDYLSAITFCFADTLDKNHLTNTVCTIPDWHIVNVTGRWILVPVYVIHLAQRIIDYRNGSSTTFFSDACKCTDRIKSCLPLFKKE